jgi:hypothetical protein
MMRRGRAIVVALSGIALGGCVPRVGALGGTPVPAVVPRPQIPAGHGRIRFTWQLDDRDFTASGEGVARSAWPDSVRLDFFLAGGIGSGGAILIADSLRLPGTELVRRLVPPAPLLWAALGRQALPATPDTVAARDGELLRADLGRPAEWRVTFRGDTLVRVDRLHRGRVIEWIDRSSPGTVRYRHEGERRTLVLRITSPFERVELDASIWRFGL